MQKQPENFPSLVTKQVAELKHGLGLHPEPVATVELAMTPLKYTIYLFEKYVD
jgi:hypothetical protein